MHQNPPVLMKVLPQVSVKIQGGEFKLFIEQSLYFL